MQGLLSILLIAAVLPGCRQLLGLDDTEVAVDAGVDPPDAAPGMWSSPTRVDYEPADPTDDDPSLTGDLLELYFNTSRGGNADIYLMTRSGTDAPWSEPSRVDELSTNSSEGTPEVSADGLSIIWSSDRPGGVGGTDIWSAERSARGMPWTNIAVWSDSSAPQADTAGCIPPGMVMVSRFESAQWDLYLGKNDDGGGVMLDLAPGISTVQSERAGCISPDFRTLYMDTDYNDLGDLYVATRSSPNDPFGPAMPITALNSAAIDDDIWVSPDGGHAFFHSNRGGTDALWQSSR